MPEPPTNFSPTWEDDTRADLPLVGDERAVLTAYLDWHRETFALKCAGVPAERMSEATVPPSDLTLHGLARHLAGAEQWWFATQFAGRDEPPVVDPDEDFTVLSGDPADALALWRAQCDVSRAIVAASPDLDATGTHARTGRPVSLRRVLVHMIAEYARHDGHADLLRERIDGRTGQ